MAKLTVLGCFEKRTLFYSFERWSYLFRKKISTRVYSTSRKLKIFWQKVLYSEVFLVRFTSNLVFAPILSLASSFIFLVGKEIDAVVSCLLFEIILPPENYWKNLFFSILLTDNHLIRTIDNDIFLDDSPSIFKWFNQCIFSYIITAYCFLSYIWMIYDDVCQSWI